MDNTSSCSFYFYCPLTYFGCSEQWKTHRESVVEIFISWLRFLCLSLVLRSQRHSSVCYWSWDLNFGSMHPLCTITITLHFNNVFSEWICTSQSPTQKSLSLPLISLSSPSWQQQRYKPGQINSCRKPKRQSCASIYCWPDRTKVEFLVLLCCYCVLWWYMQILQFIRETEAQPQITDKDSKIPNIILNVVVNVMKPKQELCQISKH